MLGVFLCPILLTAANVSGQSNENPVKKVDAQVVEEIMGVPASTTNDGVVKVSWPRKEVEFTVDGVPFRPFMGLGSWAGFQSTSHGIMLMGDTVVFEDEINPAMDAAFAAGLEITALHNHFIFDRPPAYFMHIGGSGSVEELAKGVRQVWDAIQNVRDQSPQPADRFDHEPLQFGELNTEYIENHLGVEGTLKDQVFKVSFGRTAEMHGTEFGGSMGLATWMAFAGTDELASVDGDFAMKADEVQPVLKALRKGGINITALHNHMIDENPPFYFVHFWGIDSIENLVKGLKDALDKIQ